MEQTDERGSFRTKNSTFRQFRSSCLGKIIIAAAVFAVLLIIAAITNPSKEKMVRETKDNIRQSTESDMGRDAEWLEVTVNNIGYTFSSAKPDNKLTAEEKERRKVQQESFYTEHCNHFDVSNVESYTFFSTLTIPNNIFGEPKVVGFGIFGLVIPLVNFNNFIPLDGRISDQPGKKINEGMPEEYFGDTPELGPFRNMYGE